MTEPKTLKELAALYLLGDEDARNEFSQRTLQIMQQRVHPGLGFRASSDGQDLISEIWMTVAASIEAIATGVIQNPEAWIKVIASRRVALYWRSFRTHSRFWFGVSKEHAFSVAAVAQEPTAGMTFDLEEVENAAKLARQLEQFQHAHLDSREQKILALRVRGFTLSQIADEVRCNAGTVSKIIKGIRKKALKFFDM